MVLLLLLVAAGVSAAYYLQRKHLGTTVPAATSATGPIEVVRVASWNVRQFGDRTDLDLPMIAGIITDAEIDVLAIQEVKKDGRAVDRLLATLGPPWRGSEISPMTGNAERFAFIYRGDRVQQVGKAGLLTLPQPQVFDRVPYSAIFRAGNFDFQLISVHLSYTDNARRRREAQALAQHVAELAARQTEKDIIVLGDFNEQRSRPNLDFFTAAGWGMSIKGGTNLSSREVYDNIICHRGHTAEWRDAGVVLFDEKYFGNDDKAAASVSDHRPVYADFVTTARDED
jgi:endonuclease/exonuclease/phosphatase family metal-dependent hydrolase